MGLPGADLVPVPGPLGPDNRVYWGKLPSQVEHELISIGALIPDDRMLRASPVLLSRLMILLAKHLAAATRGAIPFTDSPSAHQIAFRSVVRRSPLLPGAGTLAFIDIDSMQKRVYGRRKQGAKFGHTKIQGKSLLVRGLNALAAVISTPTAAPVMAPRGCAAATPPPPEARRAWPPADRHRAGMRLHRADHRPDGLGVLQRRGDRRGRRGGARFSVTTPVNSSIAPRSPPSAKTPGGRSATPRGLGRPAGCRVDASRRDGIHGVRVEEGPGVTRGWSSPGRDLNTQAAAGQDELPSGVTTRCSRLAVRAHPGRGTAPRPRHRGAGVRRRHQRTLAHMPSGLFAANAAWLSVAAMAHNLVARQAKCAASPSQRHGPRPSAGT